MKTVPGRFNHQIMLHQQHRGSPALQLQVSRHTIALEQIAFTWDHFVIPLLRVNLLYHVDIRANDTVESEALPIPIQRNLL